MSNEYDMIDRSVTVRLSQIDGLSASSGSNSMINVWLPETKRPVLEVGEISVKYCGIGHLSPRSHAFDDRVAKSLYPEALS